jgi:hypothetical protein
MSEMYKIEFEPQDIERLKKMTQYDPEAEKALSKITGLLIMQDLANTLTYPINCFSDLAREIGEGKTFTIGERELRIGDLKATVPAYYFPITCEEDFFDKAAELMKEGPEAMQPEPIAIEEGEEVSPEMAPPIPPEITMLKPPSEIPSRGFVGVTREEVEKEKVEKVEKAKTKTKKEVV